MYIPSLIFLGLVLLDHIAVLVLVFWGASILFSIVVVLIYIPTNSVWGSLLTHILTNICFVCVLMVALLTGVRWTLNMVLICISFMARNFEYFFTCFLTIWTSSFEKILFSSFVLFFVGSLFFFWEEFSILSYLYIQVINSFSDV
jgi:hypothetical protein